VAVTLEFLGHRRRMRRRCKKMRSEPEAIGQAALGLLEGLFRQGDRGPSVNPQVLLINGRWIGPTP